MDKITDKTLLRMNLVGGMNSYVCNEIGDEDLWERWIMLVPDECTENDLQFIAEDDELFTDVCKLFARLVKAEYEEE